MNECWIINNDEQANELPAPFGVFFCGAVFQLLTLSHIHIPRNPTHTTHAQNRAKDTFSLYQIQAHTYVWDGMAPPGQGKREAKTYP